MDLQELNTYGQASIAQYDRPRNYELTGRKLVFDMDDGYDVTLDFISQTTLEWSCGDQTAQKAGYFCSKGDDTTYLLSYELEGTEKQDEDYVQHGVG